MREVTTEDLDVIYEVMARRAVDIINEGSEAEPQVFFFQVDDETPGKIADVRPVDPRMVMMLHQHQALDVLRDCIASTLGAEVDDGRVAAMPLRQSLLQEGLRADVAVHVTEVWMAIGVDKDDPLRKLAPAQRIDRREALAVYVHVKDRSLAGLMPIETVDGKRHVEYRDLVHDERAIGGDMTMQGWANVPDELKP